PTGATGATGATGPQGPGGKILNYNATAVVGSPAPTPIGTVLGDTFGATCVSSSGDAELQPYIQTTDGSWSIDYSDISESSSGSVADTFTLSVPAGTLSSAHPVAGASAVAGGDQSDVHFQFVQFGPSPGTMIWHEQAKTTTTPSATCHLSIEAIPEALTSVAGTPKATAIGKAELDRLLRLGRP